MKNRSYFLIAIFFATLFWGAFWMAGQPLPYTDDMFYAGTGVEYAQTGKLGNSMAPGLLGISEVYYYPPFHPIALGLWLKGFGISVFSMLGFQAFCSWIFTISMACVWRKVGGEIKYIPIFALAMCGHVFEMGLRPNIFGFSVLTVGFAFVLHRSWICKFLGLTAICFSVMSLPYLVSYALPLLIWAMIYDQIHILQKEKWIRWISTGMVALIVNLILFHLAIDGKWKDWIEGYTAMAKMVPTPFSIKNLTSGITFIMKYFMNGWNLVLIFPSFIVGMIWMIGDQMRKPSKVTLFGKFLLASIVMSILIYPYFFLLTGPWVCIAYVLYRAWSRHIIEPAFSWAVRLGTVGLAALLFVIPLVKMIFQENNFYSLGDIEKIKSEIQESSKKVVLDSVSWRYIYEFKAPQNALSIAFVVPPTGDFFPTSYTSISQKKEDETWIISNFYLQHFISDARIRFTPLKITSKTLNSIPQWNDEITWLR